MKTASKLTTLALLGTFAATALTPVLADPGSQQKNKNQWRNLGIAGAVVAGYGLLTHNNTATLLGAAGGAYSANRYEQDRSHQSQDSANRQRYYYGNNGYNYNNYNNNGYNTNNYGNGRTYGDSNGNNNNGNNGGYYSGTGYGNGGYNGPTTYQSFARRHDNRKNQDNKNQDNRDQRDGGRD